MEKWSHYLGFGLFSLLIGVLGICAVFRVFRRGRRPALGLLSGYCFAVCLGGVLGGGLLWGWQHRLASLKHFHHFFATTKQSAPSTDFMYPVITPAEQSALDGAIRLSFSGDLLLLRDAAENGWVEERGEYDYHSVFEHVSDYWKSADLSIGVFEGPVAGDEKGVSTSAYADGYPLYLNFPEAYAAAVKEAGMGLVTTANNHLLDRGTEGAYHTLDVLDRLGLAHFGSYRTNEEHHKLMVKYVRGKKIVFLAYTYTSNYYKPEFFLQKDHRHLTDVLLPPGHPRIQERMAEIEQDFCRAKAENPDLLVILPHMGGQFRHEPDAYQRFWCDFFVKQGADIIFSDHSHAVQPIEWRKTVDNRQVLIVHCPGNFVNSYTTHDGDASIIAEAYLNPQTGKPFAASFIPLVAFSESYANPHKKSWQALPIYKALRDPKWVARLSRHEEQYLEGLHELITRVVGGVSLSIDQLQERYYLFADKGYVRCPVEPLDISADERKTALFDMLSSAHRIAYIGDGITEGTKNGGYGWFEPLAAAFPEQKHLRFAKGAQTSRYFRQHGADIAALQADVYVMAFGCNDIRYRNPKTCAMDANAYIEQIDALVQDIQQQTPNARMVFIAPWESDFYDKFCRVSREEKEKLYEQYTDRLEQYAREHGFLFINPNPYINKVRGSAFWRIWMKDFIHPNAHEGIRLFSRAVLQSSC